MIEFVKTFLFCVDVFFVLYLFGYSTFLFLSVIVGSVDLYQKRRDDELKNNLKRKFFIPDQHSGSRPQRGNHDCGHRLHAAETGLSAV